MANLFTSQTPSSTNNSDGTPTIVTATTLTFAVNGTITGIRYYATENTDGTWTAYLWQPTASDSSAAGTLLASKVGATPSSGTWNTITFDTPVSVTAGTPYRAGIHSSDGRYVFSGSFFTSALVNGDITGIANGATVGGLVLANGTFRIDSAAGYPSSGGGSCYFVDVEFTASGESAASPNGIEVPVTLGAPSAAFAATPALPGGIEVPVALGAPSSAFAATTATPTGVEVPVSLGAPAVYHYVRPDGIAVPVTLGEPAIEAPPGPAPVVETGSWFGLLAAVQSARSDAELNRERERNPVECPYDGWPLTPTDRGLHCEFGGHVITPKA